MNGEGTETRRAELARVADGGSAADLPRVGAGLGDPDWRVRKEAARAAAALHAAGHDVLPVLVASIVQGENVGARNAALEAIDAIGARATPALLAALDGAPKASRKFLVEALGHAGGEGIAEKLVAATSDGDPNVAAAATDALVRIGGASAERALLARLGGGDPFLRLAALDALDRLGARIPFALLERLLEERLLRRAAVPALGRSGDVRAAAPLVAGLADGPAAATAACALGLERLAAEGGATRDAVLARLRDAPSATLVALRAVLDSGARDAQRAAAGLLLLAQDVEALPAIVTKVADETLSPDVLAPVADFAERAADALLGRLAHLDADARGVAVELASDLVAPGSERGPAVRAALLAGLAERVSTVVTSAARGLARHAQPGDAAALVSVAESGDETPARAASDALSALALRSPEAVELAIERAPRASLTPGFLSGAVAAIGGPRALERLGNALSAEEAGVRRAALGALATIDGRRAAELAAMGLADERADVRAAAAHALSRMRDPVARTVAAEALLVALRAGEAPEVQAAAARALGDLAEPRAREPLRALVASGAPMVVLTALASLRALGDEDLAPLVSALRARRDAETDELSREALDAALDTMKGGT